MAYLEIRQTGPLSGTYRVQGSKNAVLPMLAATLLVRKDDPAPCTENKGC